MSPLIDCVFLLLIFFLVATMLKKEDKDIDISLPSSVSALKLPPDDEVTVIGIDKEGEFFFEGVPSTRQALHTYIKDLGRDNPDGRIRLDTDADTPFHYVVQVLDALQFRGLNNVGIRTYDEDYNR